MIRVKIVIKDRHLLSEKSLDKLMQHATLRRSEWKSRVVSELVDKNIILDSSVKVQKIRSDRSYKATDDGVEEDVRHFGYEVVVRIVRGRVAHQCS